MLGNLGGDDKGRKFRGAGWRHRNACRQSYSPADSGMKAPDTAESSDVAANMATPGREAGSSRLHFLRRPLRNSLNIKRSVPQTVPVSLHQHAISISAAHRECIGNDCQNFFCHVLEDAALLEMQWSWQS